MACENCSSGGGCSTNSGSGETKGCQSNGGCATGGCNKMNAYDWLGNMELPADQRFDIVEVRFKNGRKEFFRNSAKLDFVQGDAVVVEAASGYHLGFVALQGELVRLQMLKKKIKENDESILKIHRIPSEKDLLKFKEVQERNLPTMFRTRQIIKDLKLEMKLSDVEYQADNTKATFYYSADERVDFRELIKFLASEFKIRVEMRQINIRQEAGRVGGIGVCGRELCCSTWLTDFKNVTTTAARYQNLSLNPTKLSGQCGRLKCCLNYELETYIEELKDIPEITKKLKTKQGELELKKTDIFRKIMWFGYQNDGNWHPLSVEKVRKLMEMNEKGEFPESLLQLEDKNSLKTPEPQLVTERFDIPDKNKNRYKKNKNTQNTTNSSDTKRTFVSKGQQNTTTTQEKPKGTFQKSKPNFQRKKPNTTDNAKNKKKP